jgi:hypothetical protein
MIADGVVQITEYYKIPIWTALKPFRILSKKWRD